MPYAKNSELPDSVKNVLPAKAQEIFRKAFNAANAKYHDEERAFKIAWGAVKNAGYKKKNDKWVKEVEPEEKLKLAELDNGYIVSFEQLEAKEKEEHRIFEIQTLTNAFQAMIDNIMYSVEIEDKIAAINRLANEFTVRLGALMEAEQRKKMAEIEESKVELAESEPSPITELTETKNGGPLHAIVRLIRPGWGNKAHNHYYPKEVLKRDAHLFIGAKMYETDHRPNEKSTRTWTATIEDIAGFDSQGAPLARVAIHDAGFANRLRNLNELGMLEKMECSIYASGTAKKGFELGGRRGKQVESITNVSSVDWVTRAGAGGAAVSLVESENTNKESNMTKEINEKQELETHEEPEQEPQSETQVEQVEEVHIEEGDPEPQFLGVVQIKEILAETALPKYAQTRLAYSGKFISKEEVQEAANAELEYIKNVTQSGKVFGMDKSAVDKLSNADKLAEAEKAKDQMIAEFMQIKKKKE